MLDSFGKTSKPMSEILAASANSPRRKILVLFGTRPEAVKLAPVIYELKKTNFQTVGVSSSQHADLLASFLKIFNIKTDYDLRVMTANQTPNQIAAKVLSALDAILEREKPEIIIVQGDTTTAFAAAFAAFNRKIKVGHVEAGLRSGDALSPFPEELNRRLISQLATFHFCATAANKRNLTAEGISEESIFLCGNTVVDALNWILKKTTERENQKTARGNKNLKRVLLTTHRRQSFGETMAENLKTLRAFVEKRRMSV